MNKTAICIQLLQILNSRKIVDSKELAVLVDTNVRNISEYIKELQIAGYDIQSKKGIGGGYFLNDRELMPSIKLSVDETSALTEANQYILRRNDFLKRKEYSFAISKILSASKPDSLGEPISIYDKFPLAMSNEQLAYRYDFINEGIEQKKKIKVDYLGGSGYSKEHVLHPYKAFIYNNSWFLLAWNESINDMGYFKINRMNKITLTSDSFIILKTFVLSDYLDSFGMKQYGDYYHLKLQFTNLNTAISERVFGKNQKITILDSKNLVLECDMQNKAVIVSFVLGFGVNVKVLEPRWLEEEVTAKALAIADIYR